MSEMSQLSLLEKEESIGSPCYRGGFPCQPHSLSGKRLASSDERDLWGEFARIIGEVKPRWVLGENVSGLLTSESGRFFGRVLNDLAIMGYSIGWMSSRASWVGAVHRRERVFIVAYSNSVRRFRDRAETIQRFSSLPLRKDFGEVEEWARQSTIFEPKLLRTGNGLPAQMDRLKSLGNAVVPQQVYPILQAIADIEQEVAE